MDSDYQQPPMQMPYPSMGMSNLHAESGALQYQLENTDAAEILEHHIRGEVQIPNKKSGAMEWKPCLSPMLNDKGVKMIKGYLYTYLGAAKTFALSEFSEEYIAQQTMSVGRIIRHELNDNWNEYEVRDYASASFIIDTITAIAYATLMKGHKGNYLKFLRTTQTIQEVQHHQSMNQQPQTKGAVAKVIEKMNPFRR